MQLLPVSLCRPSYFHLLSSSFCVHPTSLLEIMAAPSPPSSEGLFIFCCASIGRPYLRLWLTQTQLITECSWFTLCKTLEKLAVWTSPCSICSAPRSLHNLKAMSICLLLESESLIVTCCIFLLQILLFNDKIQSQGNIHTMCCQPSS